MFSDIFEIYRNQGVSYLINAALGNLYAPLRSRLPRTMTTYNGVSVRAARLGDDIIPWRTGHTNPSEYEYALLKQIRERVQLGDRVVIVGGGWGVSAVVAARQVGQDGNITVYEGAEEWMSRVVETVDVNEPPGDVEVIHGIVGDPIQLRNTGKNAEAVAPSELPPSDVLILDCEGAEIGILDEIVGPPATAIVEAHGFLGASSDEVKRKMRQLGYQNISSTIAESGSLKKYCERNDIYVHSGTIAPESR